MMMSKRKSLNAAQLNPLDARRLQTKQRHRARPRRWVIPVKMIYTQMGIDVWEVIEAAKTKPFGFMPFYPGSGLGGHCIPIDPFYLTWRARAFEVKYPWPRVECAVITTQSQLGRRTR